jgi:hypothetical protein
MELFIMQWLMEAAFTGLFQFIKDEYPIGDRRITELREHFSNLSKGGRPSFGVTHSTSVSDTTDAQVLNSIFDRINRNVAKLTAQELRHAKYDGPFMLQKSQLNGCYQPLSEFPKLL